AVEPAARNRIVTAGPWCERSRSYGIAAADGAPAGTAGGFTKAITARWGLEVRPRASEPADRSGITGLIPASQMCPDGLCFLSPPEGWGGSCVTYPARNRA